jgi:hypothetical protein
MMPTTRCQRADAPRVRAMNLISRNDAIANGMQFYCTGEPCRPHGHISERYVLDWSCWACRSMKARPVKETTPEERSLKNLKAKEKRAQEKVALLVISLLGIDLKEEVRKWR